MHQWRIYSHARLPNPPLMNNIVQISFHVNLTVKLLHFSRQRLMYMLVHKSMKVQRHQRSLLVGLVKPQLLSGIEGTKILV